MSELGGSGRRPPWRSPAGVRRRPPRPGGLGAGARAGAARLRATCCCAPAPSSTCATRRPSRRSSRDERPAMCSSPPPRSAASAPTTPIPPSSSATTCRSRPTSSMPPGAHGVRKLLLPRLELHLPAARAAADPGGGAADRSARAHQRVLRHRQDRRHQAVPGLPPPVRLQCHLADADQPVRSRRQLRPRELARAARADPPLPRGEAARRRRGDRLGHGHAAPRVPARGRPGRAPVVLPDGAPTTARRCVNIGCGDGRDASANWPNSWPGWSASPAGCASTPPSPTARRASCWT